MGGNIGKLLL